eukprot:8311434-Alexandrium_andersonii.AAC.1
MSSAAPRSSARRRRRALHQCSLAARDLLLSVARRLLGIYLRALELLDWSCRAMRSCRSPASRAATRDPASP